MAGEKPMTGEKPMKCPKCGEECMRESVDVGVGTIHGPWGCYCGWSEWEYYDSSEGKSPAQKESKYFVDSRGVIHPIIPAP